MLSNLPIAKCRENYIINTNYFSIDALTILVGMVNACTTLGSLQDRFWVTSGLQKDQIRTTHLLPFSL